MSYKILDLKISNIKRIAAAEIHAEGKSAIVVEGKNANGKSSVLESITWALAGDRKIPSDAVRRDERRGEIEIKFEDFTVKKEFRPGKKPNLIVSRNDGKKISSPQTFLNSLISKVAFDPMVFMRSSSQEQVEILKQAMGIDFKDIDDEIASLRGSRTELGREANAVKGQLREYRDLKDDLEMERLRSIEEVSSELGKLENDQSQNNRDDQNQIALSRTISKLESRIESDRKTIDDLKERIVRDSAEVSRLADEHKKLETRIGVDPGKITALRNEMKKISTQAQLAERYKQRSRLKEEIEELDKKYQQMTDEISQWQSEKKKILSDTTFPIEGIEFDDEEGVLLNKLPMANASMAEKMKISLAIAMSMDSKIKIITLQDGSLLDDESLEEVKRFAKENDTQVWIERVSEEKSEDSIYIEEGYQQ